ncbi:cyclic nucleotide-binding domain-containing protein [bacterium]|jgi:CRP-like cAMP-binding protein|nr:cyclic nucleotide-binding domain-containing protein [bacterium]
METSEITAQLLRFAIFQELRTHPEALRSLAELVKKETYEVRDIIVNEREQDTRLFFLLSGQVAINKMDAAGQVVLLGKADAESHPYFGESALLGYYKKSANVVAHTRCECLSLTAQDFEKFMTKFPFVAASFFRNMASVLFGRLLKADQDIFIAGLTLQK